MIIRKESNFITIEICSTSEPVSQYYPSGYKGQSEWLCRLLGIEGFCITIRTNYFKYVAGNLKDRKVNHETLPRCLNMYYWVHRSKDFLDLHYILFLAPLSFVVSSKRKAYPFEVGG